MYNNQRSAVKWHKKERGTQALFLNKHKLHLTQVKLGEVASATCSMEDISEILNNIEAAQKHGKRRITLSQASDGIISTLLKAGFRVQRLTKGDSAAQYIVHWTRGMVMFLSS